MDIKIVHLQYFFDWYLKIVFLNKKVIYSLGCEFFTENTNIKRLKHEG